jgi:hypothetical protein
MDHTTVHIGEPKIAAGVAIGQTFVVQAELVQDGGLKVVDANFVLGDVVGKFVALTMDDASANSSSCQPRRKDTRMVSAAVGSRQCRQAWDRKCRYATRHRS